jgi:hypothetical protein
MLGSGSLGYRSGAASHETAMSSSFSTGRKSCQIYHHIKAGIDIFEQSIEPIEANATNCQFVLSTFGRTCEHQTD